MLETITPEFKRWAYESLNNISYSTGIKPESILEIQQRIEKRLGPCVKDLVIYGVSKVYSCLYCVIVDFIDNTGSVKNVHKDQLANMTESEKLDFIEKSAFECFYPYAEKLEAMAAREG